MAETGSFAEESARILLAARSEPLSALVPRVDALEAALEPNCKTHAERAELQQSAAATRLLLAELSGASVADCMPFADELSAVATDQFRALQSLGSFARYCSEHGAGPLGATILSRALDKVEWTELDFEDVEHTRDVYVEMIRRLADER